MKVEPPSDRARVGWWAFVLALGVVAAYVAYSFVGLLALGAFGYYATRPIYRRLAAVVGSDRIAAWATILLVLVPVVLLVIYAGFQAFQQVQQLLGGPGRVPLLGEYLGALPDSQRETVLETLRNPEQSLRNPGQTAMRVLQAGQDVLSAVLGGLLLLGLAVTVTYALLKNDDALARVLVRLFGGEDTTAYAYAAVVDRDLESVFFGNFLFVVAMSAVAAVAYWGTNALAPPGLGVPMLFVLAFLTGVASLIPIVVGKVVYLPVVGYLGLQAVRAEGNHLGFVAGTLVAYFLVLDVLPQTFLQPYLTGRRLDVVMMMFAYLLGPILFGWYGFFLMPILFVLLLEAVRIVLPELLHGEPLTPTASVGESIGTDPETVREESGDGEAATDDGETTGDAETGGDAGTGDG